MNEVDAGRRSVRAVPRYPSLSPWHAASLERLLSTIKSKFLSEMYDWLKNSALGGWW
jgi:hypothetical protein